MLPGAEEETIAGIEERLKTILPVSTMIQEGMTPEMILEEILGTGNVQILEKMPVAFRCQCSKERISTALISLGQKEIEDIIETEGQAEAQCHFCNEKYRFSQEELEALRDEAK
jgi:molecular chaperone Hsp33